MKKRARKIALSLLLATTVSATSLPFTALNAYAGIAVGQVDFDEGIGLPWHTCQTNPASQSFEISGGTYNVTINNPGGASRGGEDRWDLQLRHRGLKIKQGHKYNVKFDINASNDGQLCAKIGDLSGQLELWHNAQGLTETNTDNPKKPDDSNQSWDLLKIKKGDNHFECTFTARQSLDVAEWAFHYGGSGQYTPTDCFPVGTTLKFDNLSLECTTCGDENGEGCNWDTTKEMGYVTPRSDVRLNQMGYFSNLTKTASYATDADLKKDVSFVIKDSSGKEVYQGTGKNIGLDADSGEYVQILDFTKFKDAGKNYTIEVDDKTNIQTNRYTKEKYNMYISLPFDIANPAEGTVYNGVLKNALNYYYQNRSGVEIKSDYITSGDKTKLAHPAGHVNDQAYVQPKWVKAYASDGSDVDRSYAIDCTGGWYDAGDHGKYVVNGGISVWTLQNMYEMSKLSGTDKKWTGDTMVIPESGDANPDILDEARVELEWMFKMIVKSQDPTYGKKAGMVYHKMHDHKWTGLGVESWNYEKDHVDANGNTVKGWGTIRIVKPPTTAATLNVAATAAQAARLWKGIDSKFAAECLENAKLTYEAAKKNPTDFAPLDQAIGGGAYGDDYVEDDFYWAASELYATTGDKTYLDDLSTYKNKNDSTGRDKAFSLTTNLGGGENSGSFSSFNWGCTAGLGTLSLYLNEDKLDAKQKAEVEDSIVAAADDYINQENSEGMGIPYRSTTFSDAVNIGEGVEVNGYEWGSNSFVVNNAMVMAYAYKIKGTNNYMSGVSTALDYIFGRNGLGISYVTGTGDYHTSNPHHRYWAHEVDPNFPSAPDGVMSGGAGSGLQDPYVAGLGYVRGKVAPQKCYVDSAEAWSVNEVTINWNAPFAWVLSFMEDEVAGAPDSDGAVIVKPSNPSKADDTSKPSKSDEPSKADDTSKPSKSDEPSKAGDTSKPSKSDEPSKADDTSKPSKSDDTSKPGETSNGGTDKPSNGGTDKPSNGEASKPSNGDADKPSNGETDKPSHDGTVKPSNGETSKPSNGDIDKPSNSGTDKPSNGGTDKPSNGETSKPSNGDVDKPSNGGTDKPSNGGTDKPSNGGTDKPSNSGTDNPSNGGTDKPSNSGTDKPSNSGTDKPSNGGTDKPSSSDGNVTNIELGSDSLMVREGEKRVLRVFANGKDVTSSAKFAVNDTTVARVAAGNAIEGVKGGSTTVDVVYAGCTAQFTVYVVGNNNQGGTVEPSEATAIRLSPMKLTLLKDESNILSVLAQLQNGNLRDVTSEATMVAADGNVVSVSQNGIVKGLATGETTIHVKWGTFSQDCLVKVIEKQNSSETPKDVEAVILNYSNISLAQGATALLSGAVTPSGATNGTIYWTSSSNYVTLSATTGDFVTINVAKDAPENTTAVITATAGGKKATCTVNVKKDGKTDDNIDPNQVIKSLTGVPNTVTLEVGKSVTKKNVKVQPTSANSSLNVDVDSSSVASVSYDKDAKILKIKAKRPGMTKVRLTTVAKKADGNSISKEFTVKVAPKSVANLKKSSITSKSVKLSWKKQSYVTGYEIQYTTGGKTVKKKTGKNVSRYKLTKLKPNKKYKIKVRSYKKCGSKNPVYVYGTNSKTVTVTTKRK